MVDQTINFQRSCRVPKNSENLMEIIKGLRTFLPTYIIEDDYNERLLHDFVGLLIEIKLYCEEGNVGGYSSFYCKKTWNDETLENDANLKIFDLLLKIDIENGADASKIVYHLCAVGAFEAVKVRFRLFIKYLKDFLFPNFIISIRSFNLIDYCPQGSAPGRAPGLDFENSGLQPGLGCRAPGSRSARGFASPYILPIFSRFLFSKMSSICR